MVTQSDSISSKTGPLVATLDLNLLCRGYLPSVNLVIRNEQVVGSILTTGSLSEV